MSVFFPLLLHGQRQTPDIYKEASPAVVAIEGEHKSGSGFLITADGVVVTNYHVVAGEKNVSVRLASGLELAVDEVIAEDPQLDIVLLRVKGKGFPKLTLGDSDRVQPGDSIMVISNPLGLAGSVTDGLVSGVREFDGAKMLQISAPISPGSSGGPVFDHAGRVIGVARATLLGGQNLNLAVPSNVVAAIVANPKRLSEDFHASPSQSTPNVQMQKIARYIDAHLYPEARDQLRALVQDNEFDPGLRFTLAEVLFRMQDYVEAARDFEVARQLDKGFWQAAEREADAQLQVWETTRNLEARVAASRLYDDLSKAQDKPPSVPALNAASLLGVANDLAEGRLRASRQLELLMSPVGIWTTDDNRTFKVTLSSARWWLSSEGQTKYLFNVSFNAIRSPKMTGNGYEEDPTCLGNISVEASMFDLATRMEVDGFPTGQSVVSPAYQIRSTPDARSMTRICQEMSVRFKGTRMYHINLKRLQ
jgi:hypothetical protein